MRAYFRRKLGVDADEAEVLANLIADYRNSQPSQLTREEESHDPTHHN